jgi:hypothetical protein
MEIIEILITIFMAALVGAAFFYLFKFPGPWGSFWAFFLVLLLAGLAARGWVHPVGPVFFGLAWVPILFVIFLFALFLAAVTPFDKSKKYPPHELSPEKSEEVAPYMALSALFWVFIIALLMASAFGIWR